MNSANRLPNSLLTEGHLLLKLVNKYKTLVDCKNNEIWDTIAEEFNSQNDIERSQNEIKSIYLNIKKGNERQTVDKNLAGSSHPAVEEIKRNIYKRHTGRSESFYVSNKIDNTKKQPDELDSDCFVDDDDVSPYEADHEMDALLYTTASRKQELEKQTTPNLKLKSTWQKGTAKPNLNWNNEKIKKEIEIMLSEHKMRMQMMKDKQEMEKREFEVRLKHMKDKHRLEMMNLQSHFTH